MAEERVNLTPGFLIRYAVRFSLLAVIMIVSTTYFPHLFFTSLTEVASASSGG